MKKISFRVRNFDKEQFLTFNIDNDATLDEEVLDFIENEEPKGVVPVIFEEGEEFDTFSYDITDKIHICELSNQEINAEMVLRVLRSIVLTLIDMSEYRIPLSYLVLNRNYIYVDSEYRIEFVCIPLEDMQEEADVNAFLRNLLASLRFEPSENGDYVAKLFTYINNEAMFNLRNMVTLVEELMDEMNVEIPEDDSAEIYVDYQEVLDAAEELEEEEPMEMQPDTWTDETETAAEDVPEDLPEQDLEQNNIEEPEEAAVEEEEAVVEEPAGEIEPEKSVEEPAGEVEPEEESAEESAGELKAHELAEEDVQDIEETMGEPAEAPEELEESEKASEGVDEEETPEESEAAILTQEPDTSQEIVNKLKEKLARNKKSQDTESEEEEDSGEEEKKGAKKPTFKTKDTSVTGVVIQDELDEFLAEKEMEEQMEHHEESSLKIKKNIKVSRASIVKNTQEELKAAEEAAEGENEAIEAGDGEETSQSASVAPPSNNTDVPKVNPYLIRVNTNERVMITKQSFKIGKTGMGVDYTVKGNGAVSRVHAIITNQDGDYYIKDNKSTNHTYVNGKIVNDGESALLTDDCKIVLGDEEFIFKLG